VSPFGLVFTCFTAVVTVVTVLIAGAAGYSAHHLVGAVVSELVETVVGDAATIVVFKMQVIAVAAALVVDATQAVNTAIRVTGQVGAVVVGVIQILSGVVAAGHRVTSDVSQ